MWSQESQRVKRFHKNFPPKEETQTKEKPDSQKTEATIVEENKSRKSKEDADSKKPSSTTDVVIGPTDITVVEKGKMSPTRSQPKGPKRLPDVATKDVTEITKEPEIQIGVEHTKTVPLKQTKVIETLTKVSQELPPMEETQTIEKPDSQISEATSVEETKIIPKRRKSREDPVSQKPSSTTDVVIGPTDITVVEKGKMSPTRSQPKGPKRLPDVATKDVAEITKEPEIQIGVEHTKTVLLKQTKVIETLTMSQEL